jgi:Fur family ferric uptake transcriptional regulator
MLVKFYQRAEEMIRGTGGRLTSARAIVLGILLVEKQAITHHEIEERLSNGQKLDRVTLYRVLEWLNKKYLVHKVVSGDRKWRFRANSTVHSHQHAHFKCSRCTKVTCLDDFKAEYRRSLPTGYRSQEVELTVKGLCAECA